MSEPVRLSSSLGRVEISWGVNSWARVELDSRNEVEERAAKRKDLARMLESLGLPASEAAAVARAGWSARPRDAGLTSPRLNESLFRGTGLKAWQYLVIVVGLAAVFLYALAKSGELWGRIGS